MSSRYVRILGAWLLLCSAAQGQNGLITTIAGTANGFYNGSFSGDGGPATAAHFNWPSGIAVDSAGNLFVADFDNNRIRKVSVNGIIMTVAGSGPTGHMQGSFSGDNGPATSATLAGPVDVAVDAAGNLYIADTYNSRIRKVSPGGIITTVAGNGSLAFSGDGGQAASASLFYPEGVAVDASGNLFIADNYNQRIRKVSPNGIISTVAGSGAKGFSGDGGPATAAAFYFPTDIVVDASGNLIILDAFNDRVRKVSPAGIITTVAGNGTAVNCGQTSCSGDGGPATNASLNGPLAVAIDTAGNIFIADMGNSRIRKVSTNGVITTVAGGGYQGFAGDGGLAVSAFLDYPDGVALDAAGNLFIAEDGNERIREVLAQSPSLTTLPSVLNVSVVAGGSSTQQIAVSSALTGLAWTAAASDSWIVLNSASGTVPGTLSAVINTASLQPGVYSGSITIQSAQATPPQTTVAVNLTVIPAGATISVSPASLGFQTVQDGPAQSQSLQIGGTTGVYWQASAATAAGGAWLSVSPPASGNVPAALTAYTSPAGLAPGTYQGSIVIQAPGATPPSVTVSVTLTVSPPNEQFVQQSELVGSGAVNNPIGAFQGYSVALSGDGNTALVGGWQDFNFSGAAWVFTRSGGTWTQQGGKLGPGAGLDLSRKGWSVALSADGNTAAVGAPGAGFGDAGGVFIYVRSNGVWTQQGSVLTGTGAIPESGDIPLAAFQGTAVALSADGNTLLVGGPNDHDSAGAAWVFTRSGGVWSQQNGKLIGTSAAGAASQASSVALSGDGNTAILGGPTDNGNSGAVWVFTRSGGVWTQQGSKLIGTAAVGPAGQGASVSVSSDGNTLVAGGPGDSGNAGAIWMFTRSGGIWTQQGDKLVGSGAVGDAGQGESVGMSSDGNTVVVGGPSSNFMGSPAGTGSVGAAWIFTRNGGLWTQAGGILVGSNGGYASQGVGVAISGDGQTAIAGGPHSGGEFGSGAAWVFVASYSGAISAPVVSGLSPASVAAGGEGFTLTVNGAGFTSASTVEWNGTAIPTTYVSSTQLTASVPATLLVSPGNVTVTVVTIGGGVSSPLALTLTAATPSISALSPNFATAGGASFELIVNGSRFTSGSNIQWNGSAVASTYVSANQLTATIPASLISAVGAATITVLSTGLGASNSETFVVFAGVPNVQVVSHIADGAGWRSSIVLVNASGGPALYAVNFQSDSGASYTPALSLGAATGTIPVGGSTIIQTADAASTLNEGWAQVSSTQSVGGTAIFRYDPWNQEAAVPLLAGGGTKLKVPYQADSGLSLGMALANPNPTQTANVTEVIRDQTGNQLSTRALTLAPLTHTAFNPTIPGGVVGGGVAEYDSSVSIYGLGIRSAPQGAGLVFTSVDAVLPQAASTKTISHIADGGGWRSSIVLVNTDTVPVQYSVSFWNDAGASYTPPLASGSASGTIPVGGSTILETADIAANLSEGWAQVTSSQALGGTAIFRYDPWSQEAAVPLLTSGGTAAEIPFQLGSGLSLGVALANPSTTQTANITEVIRDANGNQLSSRTLTLAPLSHTAFNPTMPANTTGGGVVEYDSNVSIYALGIRSAPQASGLAFTSVRAVYK